MDRINRWKLADELNVYQISLLIAGYDPSEFEVDRHDSWPKEVKMEISPYLNAIKNAARSKRFEFRVSLYDDSNNDAINWYDSLIDIDSFTGWLHSRNFNDGFFTCGAKDSDRLSDALSEFYAPKLAAVVRAWNEVTSDPAALNGKTPKKALEIWLRKHANEYGLTNKDGNPNELGIEEICKVANWKPSGGASPTPTPSTKPSLDATATTWKARPKPPTLRSKPTTPQIADIIDDDIPF
ncbi:MAG: hypothetical protein L0Y58_11210 [Verrucomicrobia subdivision 3 bacterium]|nr:hypothetical protein [Limisphaerales bacterium]